MMTAILKKIAIGSDHRGVEFKSELINFLRDEGYEVLDCGAFNSDPVDYPVIALSVAKHVAAGDCHRGIILDGAGIGSSIAANKVTGVRAALCNTEAAANNSREHNDANVLTMGTGFVDTELAKKIIKIFLTTDCVEERHLKRVSLITDYERGIDIMTQNNSNTYITSSGGNDLSSNDIERIAARVRELMIPMMAKAQSQNVVNERGECVVKDPDTARQFIGMGVSRFTHLPENGKVPRDIANFIDHTILKPATTEDELRKFCEGARDYPFASVCVNPNNVKMAADILRGTTVKVCSVVGFPLGAHTPEVKAFEARRAIRDGAKEIDMVINIGALKSRNYSLVLQDIKAVVEACRDGSAICKVIIETSMLTDEEKVKACLLSKEARADFVKTSTGMGGGGATAHDVALMREAVSGTKIGVKASGGIRSFADAKKMIEAGASRIGAGAGIEIVKEAKGISAPGSAGSGGY